MAKSLIISLLFFLPLMVFSQGNDSIHSGRLLDITTAKGADNIHVINLRTMQGTSSDMHGHFSVYYQPGDTLLFSSVQFEKQYSIVRAESDTGYYFLTPAVYLLPTAKVFRYRTYDEFKEAVLTLPKELYEKDEIPWFRDYFQASKDEYVSVNSFSPITYLYDRYSKKAKEMQRYNFLIEQERTLNLVAIRYNADVVSRLTGLTSPEEIKKFMEYCQLPEPFILKAKDYELYLAIMNCYKQYSK